MTVLEQSRKVIRHPMQNGILDPNTIRRIGTWNVRTLYQCGRLEQLLHEFDNYRLDILGVSEMRWTGNGKMTSDGKIVLYSGAKEHHVHGVGMVLSKTAAQALVGWKPISDRILTARFQSRHAKITVIQVYAPTNEADDEEKDTFYDQLQDTIAVVPNHDIKILLGDMNAQLSSDRQGWENVIGPHGSAAVTNDNGERLLSLCNLNNLCIRNTYFIHKRIHKKTWRSPDGATHNEIDYVCIHRRWRSALRDVWVFRGADVGSDHHLLVTSIRLKLKRVAGHNTVRSFASEKLKDRVNAEPFHIELANRFQILDNSASIEEQWAQIKDAAIETAERTIGRRRGTQRERWIQDRTWLLLDERRVKKRQHDQAKTEEERNEASQAYRELDRRVKRSCRADKKDWLDRKGTEAQVAADQGDSRTLFQRPHSGPKRLHWADKGYNRQDAS
ncbi:craniofacial development protein 2-like [Ictalurus punctatus]|uniref:Craniofacial development protein 2-like n=1 Tax=Ictalurus punctatus TaxID=7998 RepID=A0A2D0RX85_ICTPU|nr:craniofacial development protein 2-like [Ictalurus punctatus]